MGSDPSDLDVHIRAPAKWSATGQPNDQFHNYFHLLTRLFTRLAAGRQRNVLLREHLSSLNIDCNAALSVPALNNVLAIKCKVLALRAINDIGHHKLIRRAWLCTGYASFEQMARWNGMSVEVLQAEMKTEKGLFKELLRAEQLPEIKSAGLPWADTGPLNNQIVCVWKVEVDGALQTLPKYFDLGLPRQIRLWVTERQMGRKKNTDGGSIRTSNMPVIRLVLIIVI